MKNTSIEYHLIAIVYYQERGEMVGGEGGDLVRACPLFVLCEVYESFEGKHFL